jgi:ribonuclease P protein component
MPKTVKFESLKGNEQFKKILSSKKVSSDLFTIYYTQAEIIKKNIINMSFVSAKKLGNAVKRNKIRRRLKMATHKALTEIDSFNNKYKYAIFAKTKVYDINFASMVEELKYKFNLIK